MELKDEDKQNGQEKQKSIRFTTQAIDKLRIGIKIMPKPLKRKLFPERLYREPRS